MQTTSALYKEIWADQSNCLENVSLLGNFVTPDGQSYAQYNFPIPKNIVQGIDIQRSCYGQSGEMLIGRTLAATLTASFILDPNGTTPAQMLTNGIRKYKKVAYEPTSFNNCSWFTPQYCLEEEHAAEGQTEPRQSETISKGKFYLSEYEYDKYTNFWKITAADKLAFMDATVDWFFSPATDGDATSDIDFLQKLLTPGIFTLPLEVDPRTYDYMNQGFPVDIVNSSISDTELYVSTISVREALGNLAALYGGNFILTADEKLLLVPFWKADDDGNFDTVNSMGRIVGEYTNDDDMTYTGVVIETESGSTFSAGSMDNPLSFDCPWGSSAVATFLNTKVLGKRFRGYSATNARIDPAAELGDYVTIDGTTELITCQQFDLRPGGLVSVSAPTYPSYTENSVYAPGRRMQMRQTAKTYSEACSIKRYDTGLPIKDAYVLAQSTWERLVSDGAWEYDVLYLPIQGL